MIYRNDVHLTDWGIGSWAALFLVMWVFFYVYVFVTRNIGDKNKKRIFIRNPLIASILYYFLFFVGMAGILAIGISCAVWLDTEEFNYFLLFGLGILVLSFARVFFQDSKIRF